MTDIDTMVDRWTETLYNAAYDPEETVHRCDKCDMSFDTRFEETCFVDAKEEMCFCSEGCMNTWLDEEDMPPEERYLYRTP